LEEEIAHLNSSIKPSTDPVVNMKERGLDQVHAALKAQICGEYDTLRKGDSVVNLNIAFDYLKSFFLALNAPRYDAQFFSSMAQQAGINSEFIFDEEVDDSKPENMKGAFLRSFREAIMGVRELWLTYSGHGVTTAEGRWAIALPLRGSLEFELAFKKACLLEGEYSPNRYRPADMVNENVFFSVAGDKSKSESERCQKYRCGDFFVTADELIDEVRASGVKDLFLVLDSCFSGAFEKSVITSGVNIVSLMSSKSNEESLEYCTGSSAAGYFRRMVEELLSPDRRDDTDITGDKRITLAELVWTVHLRGQMIDGLNKVYGYHNDHFLNLCPGHAPQAVFCGKKNLPFLHRAVASWNSECPGSSW
jgi:hypothetical protein